MDITIEKVWDGNECEHDVNGRTYVNRGRWQWLVVVNGEVARAFDFRREAKAYVAKLTEGPSALEMLREALGRVLDRMDTNNETLDDAVEAVYHDYGGFDFRSALVRFARGESVTRVLADLGVRS